MLFMYLVMAIGLVIMWKVRKANEKPMPKEVEVIVDDTEMIYSKNDDMYCAVSRAYLEALEKEVARLQKLEITVKGEFARMGF